MNDKEKLVQLAVIHAQFELLHPFLDGNGRIGRILIPLFLYEKKLISHPIFKGTGFVNTTNIPKATASRLLNALVEGGVLTPVREKTGRAGQIYRFDRLLKILMQMPTNE